MSTDGRSAQKFVDSCKLLLASSKRLQDIYELATSLHGKEKACIYFDEDGKKKSYTYEAYKGHVYYLSRHLSGALSSIPSGSLVALKLRNCPSWPLLFWAILMSGHPVLLIDAKLAQSNTANLLRQSGAKALVANEMERYDVPLFRLNDIRNAEEDESFAPRWADEVIFCSSGTTGEAKMMVYDGAALCEQIALAIDMPQETPLILHPGTSNVLAMIPLHHIFGFTATFLWYTFYGKALVYPTSMATNDLLMAIKQAPVTHLYSVPMFWDGIAQKVERSVSLKGEKASRLLHNMVAYNCHLISKEEAGFAASAFVRHRFQKSVLGTHIEFAISGGGYLSEKTLQLINGLGYALYNGYGMTEIGVTSVELSPRVEDRLKGTIGHPLHGVKYRLSPSASTLKDQGELYVSSPTLHKEEIIGGVRQAAQLTPDGYFATGDIAEKDPTGEYTIKGRLKDTIISNNGENVYPDEIEAYFKDVPHVVNSVVVGEKDGAKEAIVLILELDNAIEPADMNTLQKNLEAINASLPSEKKVAKMLIYKKAMPIANNMKVKRYVLREALKNGSQDLVGFGEKRKALSFEGFDPNEVKETLSRVRKVFSKTLSLPEFKIDDDAIWTNDLGGDSMSYVAMVNDLDAEFTHPIPNALYGQLGSVRDFAYEELKLAHPPLSGASKQK